MSLIYPRHIYMSPIAGMAGFGGGVISLAWAGAAGGFDFIWNPGPASNGLDTQAGVTTTIHENVPAGTYHYTMIGGGGSGAGSHYNGGGSGYGKSGTFTHSGGNIITIAGGRSPTMKNNGTQTDQFHQGNLQDTNMGGLAGFDSRILHSGQTDQESGTNVIIAKGGQGGMGPAMPYNWHHPNSTFGAQMNTNNGTWGQGPQYLWSNGSAGGGGGGNGGQGGNGGSYGNNGQGGDSYQGGQNQGYNSGAFTNLQEGLVDTSLCGSPSISSGTGGTKSGNSTHGGGGGGGGLVVSGCDSAINSPQGSAAPIILGTQTSGTGGNGWGAGGGCSGYNGGRGSTGQGAQGFVLFYTQA